MQAAEVSLIHLYKTYNQYTINIVKQQQEVSNRNGWPAGVFVSNRSVKRDKGKLTENKRAFSFNYNILLL